MPWTSATRRFVPSLCSVTVSRIESPQSCLLQNYPNPFNPATTIGYTLPQRSRVTLLVYYTLGQIAATLVDGTEEAGYHTVWFDGTAMASGVYICCIQAGSFFQSRRLVLLR